MAEIDRLDVDTRIAPGSRGTAPGAGRSHRDPDDALAIVAREGRAAARPQASSGNRAATSGKPASRDVDSEVSALVFAARAGESRAWEALFNRYVGLLWSIALRHGLRESDAADVVQSTWLRLLENIHSVRDPARVGAWLATTAQRESLRCISQSARLVPSDDHDTFDGPDLLLAPVDERLLAREEGKAALAALASLPPSWRTLVERLTQDPPPSYEEIGADLGVPVGSIGPTRGRCVRRMRAIVEAS